MIISHFKSCTSFCVNRIFYFSRCELRR